MATRSSKFTDSSARPQWNSTPSPMPCACSGRRGGGLGSSGSAAPGVQRLQRLVQGRGPPGPCTCQQRRVQSGCVAGSRAAARQRCALPARMHRCTLLTRSTYSLPTCPATRPAHPPVPQARAPKTSGRPSAAAGGARRSAPGPRAAGWSGAPRAAPPPRCHCPATPSRSSWNPACKEAVTFAVGCTCEWLVHGTLCLPACALGGPGVPEAGCVSAPSMHAPSKRRVTRRVQGGGGRGPL